MVMRDEAGPRRGGDATGRRAFLRRAGVGAAAAWTVPTVLSRPAGAGPGTGIAPEFIGARPGAVTTGNLTIASNPPFPADALLLAILCYNATGNLAIPAGWTALTDEVTFQTGGVNGSRARVLVRQTTPLEPISYTFTKTGNDRPFTGAIAGYQSVGGSTLVDVSSALQANTSSPTPPWPAIAPTQTERLVVRLGAAGNQAVSWIAWPAPDVQVASFGSPTIRHVTISDGPDAGAANGGLSASGVTATCTVSIYTGP